MRHRSHDMWDEMPNIGGQGSLHSLDSQEREPRLWFAKSVSKAAAIALHREEPRPQPIGFRTR